mgnify:CR=1 FL=1
MANVKLGTKAVGSIVKIKVNGASKDFIVVQQGNPNTSTYDSSCNGTWLLMKDIYTTSTFGNNNSYKDSSIHTYSTPRPRSATITPTRIPASTHT